MTDLESKDRCELCDIGDDVAFRTFAANNPTGLEMLAEKYGDGKQVAVKSDAGDFAKWLRTNSPGLNVALDLQISKLVLRSGDIWLPLTYLANDIALPVYLNLIANYLYDRMKGSLKGESTRVHFSVEFEDKSKGTIKRFTFDGDIDALQKAIKRFDVNNFLDE